MSITKPGFSYSALSTALSCNRLYQHLYIDNLKPDEPDSLTLHFGTAIHCGINSLLEGGGSESFGIYWDSVKGADLRKDRHSWADLQDMGDVFLERFARLHLKHFTLMQSETRLYGFTPLGIRLEGTPDFIGGYKDKVSVLDFKTSGSPYVDGRLQASDQLMLYTHLAQQKLGIIVEQIGYVVFVKAKEPRIQVLVMPLDQEELKKRILNIELQCRELLAKEVFPQNFGHCVAYGRKCGFWNKCHGGDK